MGKTIVSSQELVIPDDVNLKIASRVVTVTGPRGQLTRSFRKIYFDLYFVDKNKVKIEMWWGDKKRLAALRTIISHIRNMVIGVTKGYTYKMHYVYAHFPIDVAIENQKEPNVVRISNFMGQREVHSVELLPGVRVSRSDVKDEIILNGNDLEKVSTCAAKIHGCLKVPKKDIRKFLDGIYVSQRVYGDLVKDV